MKRLLREYRYVPGIVIILLILVTIASTGKSRFRYDADKHAEPSYTGSNIISLEKAREMNKEILLIINGEEPGEDLQGIRIIRTTSDSVTATGLRKIISGHDGPVILHSSSAGSSAKIWMVLSQSGFRNIYILETGSISEELKTKFRPDTINRPE